MSDLYARIDNSSLLNYLFYPRRQHSKPSGGAFDLEVPVEPGLSIVCRAYPVSAGNPWILYFHGNGEIVSDYDGIAHLYTDRGLNLLVADYRGYGASGGKPTFTNLVNDAGIIFEHAFEQIRDETERAEWYVMGRSLGSISALELAARFTDRLKGMIIESGFISVAGLIDHLGLPAPGDLSPLENAYSRLAGSIKLPVLIIHGERDRLVPLKQGRELYDALGSEQKELVIISGADHNDIMFVDSKKYMDSIANFIFTE
jgi:uncharacterized protein